MQEVFQVTDIFWDAVNVAIRLSAPMLLLSMLVGVVTAILQAVTQIHEQTVSFVLKLIVVILCIVMGGGWMLETLQEFTREVFAMM